MGRIDLKEFKKYLNKKTLIAVLCAGVLLLAASGFLSGKGAAKEEVGAPSAAERRLENILGEIQGIGRVSVMVYEGRNDSIFDSGKSAAKGAARPVLLG